MSNAFRLKSLNSDKTYTLNQSIITIGRGSYNYVAVDSKWLSGQHAEIRIEGDMAMVEDLGSTNGTFLNNMLIEGPTQLMHRDVLTFGDESFMIIAPEMEECSTVFSLHVSDYLGTNTETGATFVDDTETDMLTAAEIEEEKNREKVDKIIHQSLVAKNLAKDNVPGVLVGLSDENPGLVMELINQAEEKGFWQLGRSNGIDIVVEHPTVSSSHATLTMNEGKWQIIDNGSTNGTKVNKNRVIKSEFADGDIISLGKMKLMFRDTSLMSA